MTNPLVTLTGVDPPRPPLPLRLVGPVEYSGGVGGWEVEVRPKRRGAANWVGLPPRRVVLPLMTDRHEVQPGVSRSVEDKCAALEVLARTAPNESRPPVVVVAGPVAWASESRWVIEDIDWGEYLAMADGQRSRQEFTLPLLEFVAADIVNLAPAAAVVARIAPPTGSAVEAKGARFGGRTYTVRSGDTLSAIAGRELGDWKRWTSIANADGSPIRDPRRLVVGQVLRLP